MKTILIQPPITDPTCGYLNLSYLASYARSKRDYEISIIDANIEALHYCARPSYIERLLGKAEERFDSFSQDKASPKSKKEHIVQLSIAKQLKPHDVKQAIDILQDSSDFFDYRKYYTAAVTLIRWMSLLSIDGIIGQFRNFSINYDIGVNFHNLETLTKNSILDQLGGPFAPYTHEDLLPKIASQAADAIGIGVTYRCQFPFALYLAKEIRHRFPDLPIIMGGADISQTWKYAKSTRSFALIFKYADACVIGEGESAFVDLLDAYAEGNDPDHISNVATRKKI